MSARSRAKPWFSVSLNQRVAWDVGGTLCKHGAVVAGPPVECPHCGAVSFPVHVYSCPDCDMERVRAMFM